MIEATIVSDASPLHYLIIIDAADLLPRIAKMVIVPTAVVHELSQRSTPEKVRSWLSQPPKWLHILTPRTVPEFGLDPGESAAISLALELKVQSILVDERKGFRVALEQGLQPIGLLAVLEFSAANGWIDFEEYALRLQNSTFRCSERLLSSIRERLRASSSL